MPAAEAGPKPVSATLASFNNPAKIAAMKLFLAVLAYVLMGAVLVWGVVLVMAGKPWLLIIGFLAYLLAMIKTACLSH